MQARVAGGDAAHREEGADLIVFGEESVRVRDKDATAAIAIASRDLGDGRAAPPRCFVGQCEQANLGCLGHLLRWDTNRGTSWHVDRGDVDFTDTASATTSSSSSSTSRAGQTFFGEIGRVSEPGGVTDNHPDASATVTPTGELLDPTIVEHG